MFWVSDRLKVKREASDVASLALKDETRPAGEEKLGPSAAVRRTSSDRRRRLRRRHQRRRARLVCSLKIAAVCGAMLFLGLYGPNLYNLERIRAEIADLKAQCLEWEQRNLEVMAHIEYARSDAFVRQAARERLGLVDQGTILYVAQVQSTGTDGSTEGTGTSRNSQALALSLPNSH
jgi:cell division protein FtsB